jgi:protein gp37
MNYPYDRVWTPAKDPQAPLGWRKSYTVRVNLSGDETDGQLDRIFAVIALTSKQAYQVAVMPDHMAKYIDALVRYWKYDFVWPLPNVMLGAHASTQAEADEKIQALLRCPAAKWFAVAEPTEVISLRDWLEREDFGHSPDCDNDHCALNGGIDSCAGQVYKTDGLSFIELRGSTGPDARPVHPDWARQIRDECKEANVDFWFSGWGEWWPCFFGPEGTTEHYEFADGYMASSMHGKPPAGVPFLPEVHDERLLQWTGEDCAFSYRVGSRKSSRLLDGIEHNGGIGGGK